MNLSRGIILISTAALMIVAAGCGKKAPVAKVEPAPQPTQNTAPPQGEPRGRTDNTNPAISGGVPGNPTQGRPNTPDAATRARIDQLLAKIEDAYFDYNQHTLRPDAIKALQADSTELRDIIVQYPDYKLTIEGHADERGSEAYNIALGDARAKSARDYLAQVGIPAPQLTVVSYGKDKPICEEHDEACWQKNRRIHIVAAAAR